MKKRLLNEDVTRRFMKLANLQPLTETFLEGNSPLEEEAVDEGLGAYDRDDEEEVPEDVPVDEPTLDEPVLEPEGAAGGGPVDVHALVDAIAAAIEEETGVPIDVEGGEGEGAPDDELEDLGPLDAPEDELTPDDEIEEDLEAASVALYEDDDMVNEVTRRVARRLLRLSARS